MQVESKKSYKGLLLMLCVAVCACLFFTKSVNTPWESVSQKNTLPGIEVAMAKTSLPAMKVITLERGNYPKIFVAFVCLHCMHCAQPTCISVCPVGAIKFTKKIPKQKGDGGYKVDLRGRNWGKLGYPTR